MRLSDSVNSPLVPLEAKTLKYLGFTTVGKPNNVHVDKEVLFILLSAFNLLLCKKKVK